jgi:aminoglycoside N3'-acetyltransferase
MRSTHPHVSFAALGARAAAVVGNHPIEDGLGHLDGATGRRVGLP